MMNYRTVISPLFEKDLHGWRGCQGKEQMRVWDEKDLNNRILNPEVIASPKIIYSLDLAMPGVLRDESESSQTHPAEQQRRAHKLPVSEEVEWVDVW